MTTPTGSTPTPDGPAPVGPTPPPDGPVPGPGEPVQRSPRAPAEHDPFRPAHDPELDAGPKAPTTEAYGAGQHGLPGDHDGGGALVIGEALVDIVERPGEEPVEHPGGSPANVAVGLARLGRAVELVTWFAPDERGATLRSHLEVENVRLSAGSSRAARTSTARARLDESGSASYEFDLDWSPEAPAELGRPVLAHTGSIAAVIEPGARTVAATLDALRGTATISYDPNARPDLMGDAATARQTVERLVAGADVVKVSDEDLAWLAPDEAPEDVARRWLTTGPALVVVTRGGEGAWAVAASGEVTVPAERVDVVDTVGAGDSYMAGILDGLWGAGLLGAHRREALRAIDPDTVTRVLREAAAIAAITVSRAGANPPTRAELTAR